MWTASSARPRQRPDQTRTCPENWVPALGKDHAPAMGAAMRVESFLTDSAKRFPEKVALVAGNERLTYAELDRRSDRLAAALARAGIARHDRVIVFMDNCWEAVVAIFAVLKAGAVF